MNSPKRDEENTYMSPRNSGKIQTQFEPNSHPFEEEKVQKTNDKKSAWEDKSPEKSKGFDTAQKTAENSGLMTFENESNSSMHHHQSSMNRQLESAFKLAEDKFVYQQLSEHRSSNEPSQSQQSISESNSYSYQNSHPSQPDGQPTLQLNIQLREMPEQENSLSGYSEHSAPLIQPRLYPQTQMNLRGYYRMEKKTQHDTQNSGKFENSNKLSSKFSNLNLDQVVEAELNDINHDIEKPKKEFKKFRSFRDIYKSDKLS